MGLNPAGVCPTCHDLGRVCSAHPDLPWGGLCCEVAAYYSTDCEHGSCGCGAISAPCPHCRPYDDLPRGLLRPVQVVHLPERLFTGGGDCHA